MIDTVTKSRIRRTEHAKNPEIPKGPECPWCNSDSYLLFRGRNLLQYKCIKTGHIFSGIDIIKQVCDS